MTHLMTGLLNIRAVLPLPLVNTLSKEGIVFTQIRNYAARKGYREKREKAKVKKQVIKREFVPHNILKKEQALKSRCSRVIDETNMKVPTDDVYFIKYYKMKVYPFAEAIQCHRETHHPDMYNKPDAEVEVRVELDTQGEKKTRFVDNFTRVVAIPHKFDHGQDRSIIAFSKLTDTYDDITNAGAQLVGGVDLIKNIQSGKISLQDFQYAIAHPNILPELAALRGILKKKFPNPVNGTLDVDLVKVTERYRNGICYTAVKDEYEKNFGTIDTVIGNLTMDTTHLEENFAALVVDINQMKPKRPGGFIRRCLILSKPSRERFKVDHELYIGEQETDATSPDKEEDDKIDDRESQEAVAAAK